MIRPILFAILLLCTTSHAEIPYASVGRVKVTGPDVANASRSQSRATSQIDGSGVLIGSDGTFVTALHVLAPCLDRLRVNPSENPQDAVGQECSGRSISVSFPKAPRRGWFNESITVYGATILSIGSLSFSEARGPYRDWVVIRLHDRNGQLAQISPAAISQRIQSNERLHIVGFPKASVGARIDGGDGMRISSGLNESREERLLRWNWIYSQLRVNGEPLSADHLTYLRRSVHRNFFADQSQVFLSAQTFTGYSGGGIFNDAGQLVGITWGTLAYWSTTHTNSIEVPRDLQLRSDRGYEHPGNQLTTGLRFNAIRF